MIAIITAFFVLSVVTASWAAYQLGLARGYEMGLKNGRESEKRHAKIRRCPE